MPFVDSTDIEPWERLPGWQGRTFHSEHMTFAYWDIASDAAPLHEHHHEEEEVWHVVEGRPAITIDGVERELGPGSAAVVPADTPHSARALGACRAIVVDSPLRGDAPGARPD